MKFSKTEKGTYQVNGKPINKVIELHGAVRALKKPIPIVALRIDEAFSVETTEGLMSGKPGDYLMEGVNGEFYICPAEIFQKSYDIL